MVQSQKSGWGQQNGSTELNRSRSKHRRSRYSNIDFYHWISGKILDIHVDVIVRQQWFQSRVRSNPKLLSNPYPIKDIMTPAFFSPDHLYSRLLLRPSNAAVSFTLAKKMNRLLSMSPLATRAAVIYAEKRVTTSGTCSNLRLSPPSAHYPCPDLAHKLQTPHQFERSSL
jgi:hypothetical protein